MNNSPIHQINNLKMGMKIEDKLVSDVIIKHTEDVCLKLLLATRDDPLPDFKRSKRLIFMDKVAAYRKEIYIDEKRKAQQEEVESYKKVFDASVARGFQVTPEWLKGELDSQYKAKEINEKDYRYGLRGIELVCDIVPQEKADYDDSEVPF